MTFQQPSNLTSITKLWNYTDGVSEGMFYLLIPVSLFLIVFLALKKKDFVTSDCMMAASFVTVLLSAFLFFLPDSGFKGSYLFSSVAVLVVSVIYGMWKAP